MQARFFQTMKTAILTRKEIAKAAAIIKRGGLVAFPTETVYGLGANALDAKAVAKIFVAKRRPADNPLIVHVSSAEQVVPLVKGIPKKAEALMKKFWPGPLSIVFLKSSRVPDIVTAGLDTVVIRMPSNTVAKSLIKESGLPIAAPSANSSGKPSPTKAGHVIEDMDGRIDAIIDGGSCRNGLESTVIDVRTAVPTILRLGSVPIEEIEKVVGKVRIATATDKVRSPGMKYRHYAPKAELILIEGTATMVAARVRSLAGEYKANGKTVKVLNKAELSPHSLYDRLRHAKADVLIAAGVKEEGMGRAVMDRLRRAASRIEKV
jgi:L-threonylcarbamoyladenylate synthase